MNWYVIFLSKKHTVLRRKTPYCHVLRRGCYDWRRTRKRFGWEDTKEAKLSVSPKRTLFHLEIYLPISKSPYRVWSVEGEKTKFDNQLGKIAVYNNSFLATASMWC